MVKKEMIAMLLAGGQGSRLGVLTQKTAKPEEKKPSASKSERQRYLASKKK